MQKKEVIKVAALSLTNGTVHDWAAYLTEQSTMRYLNAPNDQVGRTLIEPDQVADIAPQELELLMEFLRQKGGTVTAYLIEGDDADRLVAAAQTAVASGAEVSIRCTWEGQPKVLLLAPRDESQREQVEQLARSLEEAVR